MTYIWQFPCQQLLHIHCLALATQDVVYMRRVGPNRTWDFHILYNTPNVCRIFVYAVWANPVYVCMCVCTCVRACVCVCTVAIVKNVCTHVCVLVCVHVRVGKVLSAPVLPSTMV